MEIRNNNGHTNNVFPRQANGDQDHSVRRAKQQMNQAFNKPADRTSTNRFGGGFRSILQLIFSLLQQIQNKQSHKEPPPPPPTDEIRALYGTPVAPPPEEDARGVYGSPIISAPPDEGARGVYGSAVGSAENTQSNK